MFLHRMVYADRLKMLPHLVRDNCLTLRTTFLNIFGVTDDIGKLFPRFIPCKWLIFFI